MGWAVKDTGLLQGSTGGVDVYTDTDSEGAPQCAPACGRFFHQVRISFFFGDQLLYLRDLLGNFLRLC